MNGRIKQEDTPEGRLAAVVESVNRRVRKKNDETGNGHVMPDYADYKAALRPWYRREELLTRFETVKKIHLMTADAIMEYMRQLTVDLHSANEDLPDEYKI